MLSAILPGVICSGILWEISRKRCTVKKESPRSRKIRIPVRMFFEEADLSLRWIFLSRGILPAGYSLEKV